MAQVSEQHLQTSLDFWAVGPKAWLTYQHEIDRLMAKGFGLYQQLRRQPYEHELSATFTEDQLLTIQPYLLWLFSSLNFEED